MSLPNKPVNKLLTKLRAALLSLPPTDGRKIARRNARKRVLTALRAVRAHIDRDFPPIVSREGVTRLTHEGRIARLRRQGWVVTQSYNAGYFAAANVAVKYVHGKDRVGNGVTSGPWVPRWAAVIGHTNQAQLRAAKKSKKIRQAVLATAALIA